MIKWQEVTPLSRWASIVLFVGVIPALSFYVGIQYEATYLVMSQSTQSNPSNVSAIGSMASSTATTPNQTITTATTTLKLYINKSYGFQFSYPASLNAFEGLTDDVTTKVNSDGVAGIPQSNMTRVFGVSLSNLDLTNPDLISPDGNYESVITIGEDNGSSYYKGPITVQELLEYL